MVQSAKRLPLKQEEFSPQIPYKKLVASTVVLAPAKGRKKDPVAP